MDSLLNVAAETGGFEDVKDLKGGPVENSEVIENIKASAKFNIPVLLKRQPQAGSFIFVAGGPTLAGYLDELKARKLKGELICTSNNTHDYLIENGIVPDVCCVIDPKEIVKTYIKRPQRGIKYVVGTICNPGVIEGLLLAGCDVEKLLVGYGIEDESDVILQKQLYPGVAGYNYLVGGTMMGLRAMPLAQLFGFKKIEYYGFDSCFATNPCLIREGEPDYEKVKAENEGRHYQDIETKSNYVLSEEGGTFYAYRKKRGENVQIARTSDGQQFITSPCFAHQVKQFIKWVDRMEGKLEVVVHGFSLSSHLLKLHREEFLRAKEAIKEHRWTEEYAGLQRQLHALGQYGQHGEIDSEIVARGILSLHHTLKRQVRMLDYGCGHGKLQAALESLFKPDVLEIVVYDPFVEGRQTVPEGQFDIVTCFDMFEHIEPQCVLNVFHHLASYVKYMAMVSVNTEDADKCLPDGRNAHITQRNVQWWIDVLSEKLLVVEAKRTDTGASFSCQAINAQEIMDNERKERDVHLFVRG